MLYPPLDENVRFTRTLPPEGRVRMVLDTDTYNEIDDQFAVVYSLLREDRLNVEAFYAAPFFNDRSSSPANGMERSYEELERLLGLMGVAPKGRVFRGALGYLPSGDTPCDSEAAVDLIRRAMAPGDEPLYVVAIGAITNVASAILMKPEIVSRIAVVWLGGQPLHWSNAREFNLMQDVPAARVVFDSGVPLVQIPCFGVASHLLTTLPELEANLSGVSPVADYLVKIFRDYQEDQRGWAKEIWDLSAVAYLLEPTWAPCDWVHSPILTDQVTWSVDRTRHHIRSANFVYRNPIFRDLFDRLRASA